MDLDILGEIEEIETIAVGGEINDINAHSQTVWTWPVAQGQRYVFRVEGYATRRSTGMKPTALAERK